MKKLFFSLLVLFGSFTLFSCDDNDYFGEDKVEIIFTGQVLDGKDEQGNDKYKKQEIKEEVYLNPKRIAVYDMSVLDTLDYIGIDTLGIEEIGVAKGNFSTELEKYSDDKYEELGDLFSIKEENLIKFNPEVVFLGARSIKNYSRIKELLPKTAVVGFELPQDQFFTTTKNSLNILKKIFNNNESKFDEIINNIDTNLTSIKEKVDKNLKALFISVTNRSFSVYGETGRFSVIYNDFGFTTAITNQDIEDKTHGESINPEYILSINPDIIFVLDHDAARGNSSTLEETLSTLSNDINAVKNNRIVKVDPVSWYIMPGGARGIVKMFNDVNSLLEAS